MTELRFGYTMTDLEKMTRAAVMADRSMAMDQASRHDIAWSAIVEALYAAEDPPLRQELIRAGWQAIYAERKAIYRSRGYTDDTSVLEFRPRVVMFWGTQVTHSHEDRLVETLAVHQVLAPLSNAQREAVVALAAHGDYRLAASALGIKYKTFNQRIMLARRRAIGLWLEGETPYRPRRTDRRTAAYGRPLETHCGKGHEWTPENTRWSWSPSRRVRRRDCRACERDRSLRKQAPRPEAS